MMPVHKDRINLNLNPATLYPPLDEGGLRPIENAGLIESKQIPLIRRLVEENFQTWPTGFRKRLSQEIKTEGGVIYKDLGYATFEKIKNDILISFEEEDQNLVQILIVADNSLKANIVDHDKLQQVLTNIFQFHENDVQYSPKLDKLAMSLEPVRKLRKRIEANLNQELGDYDSVTTHKEQMASYAYDIKNNFNEMPEIPGLDRQRIFRDVLACVTRDFLSKASKRSQEYFNTIANGQICFLNDEDFQTFVDSYLTKTIKHSGHALTLRKGLIVCNQESIMKNILNQEVLRIYHLIKKENFTLPENQEEMINLLAEYAPINYNVTDETLDLQFLDQQQANEDLLRELLEQMLWSIIYHECLHILSGSNHFLEGLDEAATYYYSTQATLKEKGVNAFGILVVVLTGTKPSIKWLTFMRDFGIDPQVAEDMYFNKDGQWNMENLLKFFAGKEQEFIEIMKWEDNLFENN